ncbi:MAG: DUF4011 domain-containing protein, partial [Spirochaetota bacterium]|nr:DUF4011 domain-containing protein [Spirochaetota bacterium]
MANIDTKLEFWKKNLIDLSKRNRLINCPLPKSGKRISRSSLLIAQPDYTSLWNLFSEADQYLPFPVPDDKNDEEHEGDTDAGNGIITDQKPHEAYKTLRALMKKAKEFNEEKGLNALYLAFGFLHWREKGKDSKDEQDMRSPLLLVPVKLTQEDLFKPIILSRLDEEITTNYSLEQKLLNDFGLQLPKFEDDDNADRYIHTVKEMIAAQRWKVSVDAAQLSLFSFLKINMYRDLERNAAKVKKHPAVRSLNGEAFGENENVSGIDTYNHDNTPPQEVFSVVDADSSQQDAILLAKRGVSFVLQGPPGTGKSQTITNIIAELVADGKKVLFVSAKKAALEVVDKRLTAAGLGDFCLELHGHKAKRREILDQFEHSVRLSRKRHSLTQDALNTLSRLKETRALLNRYSEELHTIVKPLDRTIYQVNGALAKLDRYPNIDYVQEGADKFSQESLAQCGFALEELTRVVSKSGYQDDNPWRGCVIAEPPGHTFRQQFAVNADKLSGLIDEGRSVFQSVAELFRVKNEWAFISVSDIIRIQEVVETSPKIPPRWLSLDFVCIIKILTRCIQAVQLQNESRALKANRDSLQIAFERKQQKYSAALGKWQIAHDALVSANDEDILAVNASALLVLYRTKYRTWMRVFIADFRKAQKTLLSYHKTAGKFTYSDGLMLLDTIAAVQSLKTVLDKQLEDMRAAENVRNQAIIKYDGCERELANIHFSAVCADLSGLLGIDCSSADYAELKAKMEWAEKFAGLCAEFHFGKSFLNAICQYDTAAINSLTSYCKKLCGWQKRIQPSLDKFSSLFDESRKASFTVLPLRELNRQFAAYKNNFSSLEYWVDYRSAEKKITELGIDVFLAKAKEIDLSADDIIPVFMKCFYRSWLDAIMPGFSAIHKFRRLRQDERVALFKGLDTSHIEISRAMLIERLIARLPNFDAFGSSVELALLRREMAKKRKLMPIRKLIAALPNLLPALKPCVMMSPLSVSTYLGESNFEFDTVLFDEASQVRTEEAIGAIFRARQTIIAGDRKQLPPTDFFSALMSGSDEYEEDEDGEMDDTGAYESLLDEAALWPSQTLRWHYRSRHEHLIAFSNAKIYQGKLITFPSSVEKREGMGVEYIHVPGGTYKRGGGKDGGNRAEAHRVAELVFEHLKQYPGRSLGIIAFGKVQEAAIEAALDEKRTANPDFEPFFKEDEDTESLFIKNLETVQGDERDTIIFSIGYAPDESGKFIMNFGPLSRNGGERRLNVAVTRARYNLKLVGSILPTDIKSGQTSGEGPQLLRLYIDFAINGEKAILGEVTTGAGLWFDSPFEEAVYDFLIQNG